MIKYLALLFLFSCASTPKVPVAKLFPFGTYHHNVKVTTKTNEMSFVGINQWTKERFVVVGLGPMDMTMIKYEENKVAYTKDLYINKELMPLEERHALQLLSLIKDMYDWDRSICEGQHCSKRVWGIPVKIELNTENQVSQISVAKDNITVVVDVTAYEKVL